jgi:hypothetical protein
VGRKKGMTVADRRFAVDAQAQCHICPVQVNRSLLREDEVTGYAVPSGCKPYVVVLKHKMAIGKVDGANAAELNAIIGDNIPPVPE